jgi:hypothetical protein
MQACTGLRGQERWHLNETKTGVEQGAGKTEK